MTKIIIKLLILIAVVALGLFLGPKLIGEKGYVLITLGHWKIELTVISALLLLVASYFFVWLLLRLFATLLALTGISANWLAQFSSRHRKQRFFRGLLDAKAGRWVSAEKQLKASTDTEWSGVDWLTLAEIAQAKGEKSEQLEYLRSAFKVEDSQLVALKKLAEYFRSIGQPEQINTYLEELNAKQKGSALAVMVKADLLALNGEWQQLQEQLPSWKKSLSKPVYEELNRKAALGCYAEIASKKGANELKNYWRLNSRKNRKDVAHQQAYIELLIQQDMHVEAEKELLELQSKKPEGALLPLFRKLKLHNPTKSLQRLEGWLKDDGNNLQLLDTIAEVALNSGDFELAEKVLRKRLSLQADAESKLLLAKTKVGQQDLHGAVEFYQQIT